MLELNSEFALADDDLVQPFQIEGLGVYGRLVRLGPVIEAVLARNDYPEPVARLLAELVAVTVTLGAALKFDGTFSAQLQSDGPVRLIVVDYATNGSIRAYAAFDRGGVERASASASPGAGEAGLLGKGLLALTVDRGPETDRYQGLVELAPGGLDETIRRYFDQSEQLEAALSVAVTRGTGNGRARRWRAGCLMVQHLPPARPGVADEVEDLRRQARALAGSVRADELTDAALSARSLLARLFRDFDVRVYRPRSLRFGCRCSRARALAMLQAMAPEHRAEAVVEGRITVTCHFCNETYEFAEAELVEG